MRRAHTGRVCGPENPLQWIGVSPGAIGTAMAQQHLRNIISYLDMPAFGQPEAFVQYQDGLFNSDGSIGKASLDFLRGWMDRYVAVVRSHVEKN
jgi:chromate reductase